MMRTKEFNGLETEPYKNKEVSSTMNLNRTNNLVILFKIWKGLLITFLLPYLDINDKTTLIPAICVTTRLFVTSPKEERHFYNCVSSNFIGYAAEINT